MVVGICKLDLHIPACRSLKEKRRVLRKIKDRTSNAFKVLLAEVDDHDKWQRAQLGFAVVGADQPYIEGLMTKVLNFIGGLNEAQILDQYTELINV